MSDAECDFDLEERKYRLELEKLAHTRWWHEDTLVHNRMTWLLQSQVLLFAAYGIFARGEVKTTEIKNLLTMLPFISLLICIFISIGIHAAWKAQKILDSDYKSNFGIGLGVHGTTNTGGKITGIMMPLVFATGWGWLFGREGGLWGGSGAWALAFFGVATVASISIGLWLAGINTTAEDASGKSDGRRHRSEND